MTGEKFTLMQYSVNAILGLIEAEQFVIPEIQRAIVNEKIFFRSLLADMHGVTAGNGCARRYL